MHLGLKGAAVLLMIVVLSTDYAHSQVSALPNTAPSAAPFTEKETDFIDFKPRILHLIESFDHFKTRQSDIEEIMGVVFQPDAEAKSFEMEPSPYKVVAPIYKSLKVQQYLVPLTAVVTKSKLPPNLEGAVIYGFENYGFDFPHERDSCLSIHELKMRFQSETGWQATSLGMFYPGITGSREGAKISAYIDRESYYLPPAVEAEFLKLTKKNNFGDDPKKVARYEELKAEMDGCIFILDLF